LEWGKGQWLSEAASASVPDLESFRTMLAQEGAHYLSFVVGSDTTIAMFVPACGDILRAEIDIGREEIADVAAAIKDDGAFRTDLANNLALRLGRLTAWLPAPGRGAPIETGDVVIVSPHGPLHEIPMHVLPVGDGMPIAPRVATVRSHGAATVALELTRKPARPSSFIALRAPAASDANKVRQKTCFDAIVAVLSDALPGETREEISADFASLLAGLRASQIVHLWAHGDVAFDGRYFTRSGLLLAHNGRLPERGSATFETPHLLSPRRLLDVEPRPLLTGSHVTLQACVSGHARANLRGDAIGLEWAFLLAGAGSVLASHWHVDFPLATKFCVEFYRFWTTMGLSRAEAWRRTVEAIRNDAGMPPSAWAAFSLTGDWR
jgi:CHAT domain-containing protein